MALNPRRITLLQQMALFGGLTAAALETLLAASRMVDVPAGTDFFSEGDAGEAMYILEAGSVAVIKATPDGPHVLQKLSAGDCFGEMALMDMSARSATVRAEEACSAIELPSSALLDLYERDLSQFALLMMNMGREVSRRLRKADERPVH